VQAARARGVQLVIVDTAGRLHTKYNLMEELKKVKRVLTRLDPDAPHHILLVLDATTGQNGLVQARSFTDAVGCTGILLAKLDGTAKGGIVLAIAEQLRVPVVFIGTGERLEDLAPFDPEEFVEALFAATP
ncbi:MAG: signal recognition particle-docking protein FtsY, partial [Chloroflexi bacterium]|nr:signal recognition particle-docking protein FtsY [Chloroflexota bacterium]